jgi:hypothetical protein
MLFSVLNAETLKEKRTPAWKTDDAAYDLRVTVTSTKVWAWALAQALATALTYFSNTFVQTLIKSLTAAIATHILRGSLMSDVTC